MIKSTIAAVAATPLLVSGAAFAGPYVNVETVSSYSRDDYTGLSTEFQIGYEGENWYVSGGPVIAVSYTHLTLPTIYSV